MICIIAPNPSNVEKKEGYMQRVSAIDRVFADTEKIYFEDISDINEQKRILLEASAIYVHSIYQVRWLADIYKIFPDKIITDLHGIVPEEESYIGSEEVAKEMAEVERLVFDNGKFFIAVSQKMVDYYNEKYRLGKDVEWIVMPMLDTRTSSSKKKISEKRLQVIYAGGMQRWQKPEIMVEAIKKRQDCDYIIYTYDFSTLNKFVGDDVDTDKLIIKSGTKEEIINEYSRSDLGFIIRDDHVLNRVSCPTKLIEYLSYGVVPIVLSPNMGDFESYGYKFVLYDDFINKQLNKNEVHEAARHNLKIIRKMNKMVSLSIKRLKELSGCLDCKKPIQSNALDSKIVDVLKNYRYILNLSGMYKKRIGILESQIQKKNDEIAALRSTISDMSHSKRWILGDFISKSKNISKWKFKK